jgi:hypothetical protein
MYLFLNNCRILSEHAARIDEKELTPEEIEVLVEDQVEVSETWNHVAIVNSICSMLWQENSSESIH